MSPTQTFSWISKSFFKQISEVDVTSPIRRTKLVSLGETSYIERCQAIKECILIYRLQATEIKSKRTVENGKLIWIPDDVFAVY